MTELRKLESYAAMQAEELACKLAQMTGEPAAPGAALLTCGTTYAQAAQDLRTELI